MFFLMFAIDVPVNKNIATPMFNMIYFVIRIAMLFSYL